MSLVLMCTSILSALELSMKKSFTGILVNLRHQSAVGIVNTFCTENNKSE